MVLPTSESWVPSSAHASQLMPLLNRSCITSSPLSLSQLVIGADYCHKRGVANRDIKLENTLLQMVKGLPLPLLKICDFGSVPLALTFTL